MSDHPDRAWLTPLLNKIADAAGEDAAITLGRAKAGEEIYIPEKVTPVHWLSLLIGYDEAKRLVEAFGVQHLTIPPALAGAKRSRAVVIAEMVESGYSTNAIVRATGVARSTVMDHRAKLRARRPPKDDPQGSLF